MFLSLHNVHDIELMFEKRAFLYPAYSSLLSSSEFRHDFTCKKTWTIWYDWVIYRATIPNHRTTGHKFDK